MNRKRAFWATLVALAFPLATLGSYGRVVVVQGESMLPTLHDGQVAVMQRWRAGDTSPRPGDIVVFREKGVLCVKRVIATGGETVDLVRFWNGIESPVSADANGARIRRYASMHPSRARITRSRIPAQTVYVVGDNTPGSVDSRHFGPVPLSQVLGRIVLPSKA